MEGSVTLSSEYHIPSNIYCLYRCIRRQYEQYVCKRIPGKQAVVVMACDNTHIRHAHSVVFSLSLYIYIFFATEAYNGGPVSPLLGFYFMSFVWQLQQILSFFEICMFSKCVKL